MIQSENSIAAELIRYYQQKEALQIGLKTEFTKAQRTETLVFYNWKIKSLRKQLNEINPARLQEIDTQRANDCTVTNAEHVQA